MNWRCKIGLHHWHYVSEEYRVCKVCGVTEVFIVGNTYAEWTKVDIVDENKEVGFYTIHKITKLHAKVTDLYTLTEIASLCAKVGFRDAKKIVKNALKTRRCP